MPSFKDILLEAPDSQLDSHALPMIQEWNEPPTALQVLKVLDFSVRYAWGSNIVMKLLNFEYRSALTRENTTNEEVVKLATWRDDPSL